jgi:hypothetical protein
MSYTTLRAKSRTVNRTVYQEGRVVNFLMPHMRYGNLNVEHNEQVGNDLDVCGNLTVAGDLRARNFYASGNYYLIVAADGKTSFKKFAVNR